jgi:hypothetical protein
MLAKNSKKKVKKATLLINDSMVRVLYGTYGTVFQIASSRPYIVTRSTRTNCADVVDYYWENNC